MPSSSRTQLVLPVALLAGVLVLVFPLPSQLIDGLLALNLSAAIVILVTAVMIKSPIEFSVFPTLLLTTTLARLVLNVATTRLILADADIQGLSSAGGVIRGFAEFVARDDIIVGGIIFAILVVIQFLVVTKGATRISEVAARFALDGMPGRQMAIDADVNAGNIDHKEAQRRRAALTHEAEFHGAMDGASKFLRGDALAGMTIIAINLVGGLAIGITRAGMSVGEAAEVYSKLTIGDGLVSQLPALLISVAAGIVITRNSCRSELGADLFRQLLAKPQPLLLAVGFLLVLVLARFPVVPLLAVGGALAGLAFSPVAGEDVVTASKPQPKTKRATETKCAPDPANSLSIDPLGIEVGLSLVRLADPSRAGTMLQAIADLRHRVARELGILLPKVRIRDNLSLDETTYRLMFFDTEVATGQCPRRHVFAMTPTSATAGRLALIPEGDWVPADQQSKARAQGRTILSASEFVVEHLHRVATARAAELMTRDAVHRLIEQARPTCGVALDELVPHRLSLGNLQKVLQHLVANGISIRNLPVIIETLCDEAQTDTNPKRLAAAVEQRLASLAGRSSEFSQV